MALKVIYFFSNLEKVEDVERKMFSAWESY